MNDVHVSLFQGKDALTVDKAKELLGWKTIAKGDNETPVFRDLDGNRIALTNNTSNRPFRMGLAKRYASEMLRKKWRMNGEPIIIDCRGLIQSGQHRLVALVLAEQERKKNVEKAKTEYGWRKSIAVDALVVTGISDKPDCVDTLDLGQKRSLGDVVFRNHDWSGYSEREQRKLSNVLSGATRLTWLRTGGKVVSAAPHFPHSEALDFMKAHPGIRESVEFVFNEDGGTGAEGKKLSTYVTLGYAAGLHYLMTVAGTDPNKFEETGKVKTNFRNKADEFWVLFGSGAFPVLTRALVRIDASGGMGRDEVCGTIVKAFNRWVDGKDISKAAEIKVKRTKNEAGKVILAETPRIGGLDVEVLPPFEAEADAQDPED